MNKIIHSYKIYPIDEAPPKSAEVFYRECTKKHDGKIPTFQCNDRQFVCNLFLHDVKIRDKLKEYITEIPAKEKLLNLFF
jgi:hypothetical protein